MLIMMCCRRFSVTCTSGSRSQRVVAPDCQIARREHFHHRRPGAAEAVRSLADSPAGRHPPEGLAVARLGNSPPACTCTKPSAGSAWPKVTNGSKMVTPWPSPSGESGSHPDDPARHCARGHRRGFNTLRALAQIRGETGSLETAPSATQSCWCSHSGIARGSLPFSLVFVMISAGAGGVPRRREASGAR